MPLRALIGLLACSLVLVWPAPAGSAGDPSVAALQVALRGRGLYAGPVDGVAGPGTRAGVVGLQRRAGLVPDGVVGPRTRGALGRLGAPPTGSRVLAEGDVGWDVAALQFQLAWHGFPSGPFDGAFGPRTERALFRYQRWARLTVDGVAGGATFASLHSPSPRPPLVLARPLPGPIGDPFGPRGDRFHTGVDFPADAGTGIAAAGLGRVSFAGWMNGGWGYVVTIRHRRGVRTMYAHLSRLDVRVGERVQAGFQIGLVGSTGHATGPHLHFEVRARGAAVDPVTAFR